MKLLSNRDRIRPTLYRGGTVVNRLGHLPRSRPGLLHLTLLPGYIRAAGTPPNTSDPSSSRIIYHPSTRIIHPQTGRRVLPPPKGPNLSKLCVPFQASCATIKLSIR